jgi:hypothetical protein
LFTLTILCNYYIDTLSDPSTCEHVIHITLKWTTWSLTSNSIAVTTWLHMKSSDSAFLSLYLDSQWNICSWGQVNVKFFQWIVLNKD